MSEEPKVVPFTTNMTLEPNDSRRLAALCGPLDQNLKQLEKRLGIHLRARGNLFEISGPEQRVKATKALLAQLYRETLEHESIDGDFVHLYLQESGIESLMKEKVTDLGSVVTTRRKSIKPRGGHQTSYVKMIRSHDINFGVGPAGTGKTYLAVACAVEAIETQRVARILLVRPAVEAGEKLGFLPGDLAQKIDPYLRPLYDALYEMMGVERVNKYIERNIIEVAPLAYMRGRTLNNAFIILDEAQNSTSMQIKMFLTRLGPSAKCIITGDLSQVDLPRNVRSGLRRAVELLGGLRGLGVVYLSADDVVRHRLVKEIILAYDREEEVARQRRLKREQAWEEEE